MWSGPRNISTAMMRAWGNRPDTVVCDEPLYAYYLKQTGYTHHPSYAEILAHHETDLALVIARLTGPIADNKTVFYQKHMAHHLLPETPLEWIDSLANVFLIRDPREVLLSLTQVLSDPTIEETGFPQQWELFKRLQKKTGQLPPVIDAKDVLQSPPAMLELLCDAIDIPYDSSMLEWQPGIHATDGVWASHWYGNIVKTTTFAPYRPRREILDARYHQLLQECQAYYDSLATHKLTIESTKETTSAPDI